MFHALGGGGDLKRHSICERYNSMIPYMILFKLCYKIIKSKIFISENRDGRAKRDEVIANLHNASYQIQKIKIVILANCCISFLVCVFLITLVIKYVWFLELIWANDCS